MIIIFFKQKTLYKMRISDWSSDVCSSDLEGVDAEHVADPRQRLLHARQRVPRKDHEEVVVEDPEDAGVDLLGLARQHDAHHVEAFRQALEDDQLGQVDLDGAMSAAGTLQPFHMVEQRLLLHAWLSTS